MAKYVIMRDRPLSELWNRFNWPMPVFIRSEPIPPFKNWRVYYSEKDPSVITKEEPGTSNWEGLPRAGLSGAGAAESKLTALLEKGVQTRKIESGSLLSIPEKRSPSVQGGPFRVEVLSQLRSFGSDTAKPHHFDFFLYFESEAAAHNAAKKIRENEFIVEVLRSARDDKWLCRAKKILVPGSARLDEIASYFEQIAAELRGEFDGWESDVVKS